METPEKVMAVLTERSPTLRFDPYGFFAQSTTPVGLYARQKWLNQATDPAWQTAFDKTVAALIYGQDHDGSWGGSVVETVRHLFGLHLTVRHPTDTIAKGIDWLFRETASDPTTNEVGLADLGGLPFVPGDPDLLCTGMTLFLATVFGRENNPEILALYQNLSERILAGVGLGRNPRDISNLLRALVVHPIYAKGNATASIVEGLSMLQDGSGQWPGPLPFYQTVNALAHLEIPQAEKQLEKAFALLAGTQNSDGTWGGTEQEWNTFLVVHALRKKKMLW